MLKALVFDDEYIVLEGLKTMIDWNRYGIELAGTASDGISALSLFRQELPDMIFTDIRMPGMDGLQLIETILGEYPDTVCIVFSGFNEFEYVKRAIKAGVVDYLEKPVTISKIEEAIGRTLEKITQQKEVTYLKLEWEKSRQSLLQKNTLDLLLSASEADMVWRDCFGPDVKFITGVTVIVSTGTAFCLTEHPSYRVIELSNGPERITVVVHLNHSEDELLEEMLRWSGTAEDVAGSGQTYNHMSEAAKSYKEALRALRYGRFLEEKGWIRFEDIGGGEVLPEGLSEREEALIFYMRTGDKAGLLQQLELFNRWMEAEKLRPEIAEREMLKLVYLGLEVAKETGGDTKELWHSGFLPHKELEEMKTREDMFTWLKRQMEMLIDWTQSVRLTSKHAAVDKAVLFIKDSFNRDITLQEVAQHVGMNATYFSLLFKEEMGVSYIKYLTKIRMETAKTMLKSGMRVNEVSDRIGYYNYRHFTEVFKKHIGLTPGQYRDVKGASPHE